MSAPETKGPDGKRRLPLLPKTEVAQEGDEERPPWHWAAIGAAAIFVFWLPLAFLANAALARVHGGAEVDQVPRAVQALMVGVNLLAFALASFAAGLLVGRFGGKAGPREATLAGLGAATIAWMIGIWGAQAGLLIGAMLLALLVAVSAGSARLGGSLGLRSRKA